MELLAVDSMTTSAVAAARPSAPVGSAPEPERQPAKAAKPTAPPAEPAAEPVAVEPVAAGAISSAPAANPELAMITARWAEVVERAAPAIKPLLRECRPVSVEGVRLTLAFPEERRFMREKAATRAKAIEDLLAEVLTGSWAIECVTSNVELEPLTVAQAVAQDPADPDGQALLEGVLRITGGELVDVPEVR
jgi:hypothetical protein